MQWSQVIVFIGRVGWWEMWKGNGEVFQESISIEDETNSYFNFR